MIAMALSCDPDVLIADEPTTALDVTIQAQILDLMNEMQQRLGSAIVMITHDLGVVAETCKYVLVMYAGSLVEYGTATQIFSNPRHPYTMGLLESLPRLDETGRSRLRADRRSAAELAAHSAGLFVRAALQVPHADLRPARAALRLRGRPRGALFPLRRIDRLRAARSRAHGSEGARQRRCEPGARMSSTPSTAQRAPRLRPI